MLFEHPLSTFFLFFVAIFQIGGRASWFDWKTNQCGSLKALKGPFAGFDWQKVAFKSSSEPLFWMPNVINNTLMSTTDEHGTTGNDNYSINIIFKRLEKVLNVLHSWMTAGRRTHTGCKALGCTHTWLFEPYLGLLDSQNPLSQD